MRYRLLFLVILFFPTLAFAHAMGVEVRLKNNQIHIEAWKQGIKTLYYMRTESVLRGDIAMRATDPDCLSCDG